MASAQARYYGGGVLDGQLGIVGLTAGRPPGRRVYAVTVTLPRLDASEEPAPRPLPEIRGWYDLIAWDPERLIAVYKHVEGP